ncbi:DUF5979 domain-containing protein [Glycomyces artemisiae]|uniref:Uncharacterized protein n=1 Tax=Glycomyces artemisiae TaxID=1076443 RepID=A0A2T0UHH9_9ACTN|nr:DUF5979 domain-containing protein [Glycomyces artemisiae]PRY57287.1 hypothetical protein B0I28_107135 [Glycomyces artemisiae]
MNRHAHLSRLGAIALAATAAVALATLGTGSAALAAMQTGPRLTDPAGLFTETTLVDIGDGTSLSGFDAPDDLDPLDGYPTTVPAGSVAHAVSYAGTLEIEDPQTGRDALAYCIDLNTDTEAGVHYVHGEWSEANVPNLGYVEYILLNYYPTTGEPAAAASAAQRAAAVQAAIWFFTDRFVLNAATTVGSLTAGIVADALAGGPAAEPDGPELAVSPTTMPAPDTGEIVGPFTVIGDGPATLRTVGVEVFTDPDGAGALADGDTVAPGSKLWARLVAGEDEHAFILDRVAEHLVGTVYLYDGSNPDRDEAQKLILAQSAELVSRAGAELTPYSAGGLEVTKRIDGPGAGRQDEILIRLSCTDPAGELDQEHTLTVPAAAPAGDHVQRVGGIPAGSECTVAEIEDGSNSEVRSIATEIEPGTATVTAGEVGSVTVANTYGVCDSGGDDSGDDGPGAGPGGCPSALPSTGGKVAATAALAAAAALLGGVLLRAARRRTA